jgi:hypothetical protein
MENIKPPVNGAKGKADEEKIIPPPWWVKYVFVSLCGIGWFIKDIVADGSKTQREMYDKLYQQQNRLIEVVDGNNKVLEDAIKIIQDFNTQKSRDIIDIDSTYYWRSGSIGNGGSNKK